MALPTPFHGPGPASVQQGDDVPLVRHPLAAQIVAGRADDLGPGAAVDVQNHRVPAARPELPRRMSTASSASRPSPLTRVSSILGGREAAPPRRDFRRIFPSLVSPHADPSVEKLIGVEKGRWSLEKVAE